jgi:membrane protein
MGEAGAHRGGSGLSDWQELRKGGRRMVATGVRSFADNNLIAYASTIAFQVLLALIPLALTALALLGFLDLEEIWESDIAPAVEDRVQPDAFSVIDRTADEILGEQRGYWLTLGAALALWQVSGAVRATITPLNKIYGAEDERSWWRRMLVSLVLALAIGPLVIGAALLIRAGPRLVRSLDLPTGLGIVADVLRWGLALALLATAVWLLIKYAPANAQPLGWAGIGTVFVVVSWVVASLGFGLWAAFVANYGSVFAGLATAYVLLTYLYLSSLALLFGIQLDQCVRQEVARNDD